MENPDRLKIENASNLLYDTQIYNAETVRKAVIGYKPAHTAKAWTSDPDYKVLLSLFEGAVIRKRSTRKKKKAGLNMKKKKQKLAVIKRNDNDESQL